MEVTMKWEYLQIMMTTKPVKEGHSRLIVLTQGGPGVPVLAGKRLIDLLIDMSSVDEAKDNHDIHLTNSSLILKRAILN
jgi:hypothetical protein